jgi:hypothetical protein
MSQRKISVVCCDDTPEKHSQIVEIEVDSAVIEERTLDTIPQQANANDAKGLHNAAHHAEHGPVTYLQEVREGGFAVLVGDPANLQSVFFGAGTYVGFMDDEGPGHGSRVGPDGVVRTLRILKGHLEI